MVLTEKQRQDLCVPPRPLRSLALSLSPASHSYALLSRAPCRHQSVLDYLSGMGERFADSAAAFEREAGISKSVDGAFRSLRSLARCSLQPVRL